MKVFAAIMLILAIANLAIGVADLATGHWAIGLFVLAMAGATYTLSRRSAR